MARKPKMGVTSLRGVYYRYCNYDVPFWVRNNSKPGRWHVPEDGPTQYLSATANGAWAELIRNENLRSESEVALIRMPLWQARIDQRQIADYSTFEMAEAAGFPAEALVDDDQSRCQVEGRRLREAGYLGVIAPSAAIAGEVALTLFGPRLAVGWESEPSLATALPAANLGTGTPPLGLVERVRHLGEPHPDLLAYERQTAKARTRRQRPSSNS